MRYKILLRCFAAFSVILAIAADGSAQSVFRLGAWCFRPGTGPEPIYQLPSGEWRVRTNERDKLLNLGLNYFVACTSIEAEQASARTC